MATTSNRYTGDGSTTRFAVTFTQYSWTSIEVYVNNELVTSGYTYDSTTKEIVFNTAPLSGYLITLRRLTDATLLYKFGEGAAFTGANIDSNFSQYQSAVEEVQNAADKDYVDDLMDAETAARIAGDQSLQNQISGGTVVLEGEISPVMYTNRHISNSIEIPAGHNAFSVGPQIIIDSGVEVTLGEDATWAILGNAFTMDEQYNLVANKVTTSDGTKSIEIDTLVDTINGLGTMSKQNATAVAITGGTIAGASVTGGTVSGLATDLAIADGGTGASTAAAARTNLGLGTIATQAASAIAITGGSITGITDLAVADGGTGASTAAAARTNLGALGSVGVTDGSDAAAGVHGEYMSAQGTATSMTSSTYLATASIALTPGDWDLTALAEFTGATGCIQTTARVEISTSNTTPLGFGSGTLLNCTFATATVQRVPVAPVRVSITANTTYYLLIQGVFSGGTMTGRGLIQARRVR
jgi:Phage T7 tail fibre protein.